MMSRNINYKKEEIENILLGGGRIEDVARFYNCSRATAWRVVKKFGLEYRRLPFGVCIEKEELCLLLEKKIRLPELARLFNCSISAVFRAIKKFGLAYGLAKNITKGELAACLKNNCRPKEIANKYGYNVKSIYGLIKKFNLKLKKQPHPNIKPPIDFTTEQKNIISGAILGDGHISNNKSGNSRFIYGTSIEAHTKFVGSFFSEYLTSSVKNGPKHKVNFSKRFNKVVHSYFICTQNNITLTKLRHKWYKNGKKTIPKNIRLNKLILLIWYIGDGCLDKCTGRISFATNCFLKSDLEEIILPQMKKFEASISKVSNREEYIIMIPKRKVRKFLNFIGPCPFPEMQYKWNFVEYKDERKAKKHFKKENSSGQNYC